MNSFVFASGKNIVHVWCEMHLTYYVAEQWQCFQNQEAESVLGCSVVVIAVTDFSIFPIWRELLPWLARQSNFRDRSLEVCAFQQGWSKMELIVGHIPLWVHSLSFKSILNVSESMHHSTPNTLSTGNLSLPSSRPLISFALSSAGTDMISFLLLLTNFVSLNPPSCTSL